MRAQQLGIRILAPVAVIAAALGAWLLSRSPEPPRSVLELLHSLESPRPFELRWPGLRSYAPCPSSTTPGLCGRSLSEHDHDLLLETLRVRHPSQEPRDRHVAEIARLLLSPEPAGLLRARRHLQTLVAQDPESSELRAHLAIVTSSLATARDEPWDQIRALALWLEALETSPAREEGLFNLALLLQSVGLEKQAQKAWAELLAHDPFSSWAVESRAHLERLQRPTRAEVWDAARAEILSRHVRDEELREWVEAVPRQVHDDLRDELLAAWITDWSPSTPPWEETPHSISNIPRLASFLARATGDNLLQESLTHLRQASPADVPPLRRALRRFRSARRAYHGGNCEAARADLTAALPVLVRIENPLAHWVRAYLAFCRFVPDLQAGRGDLTELATAIDARAYPLLAGEIRRMLGIAAGRLDQPARSFEHYEAAIEHWTRAWGEENSSSLLLLRGEISSLLGHRDSAWRDLTRSLRGLARDGDLRGLHSALVVSGSLLLDLQLPEVALQFREEAVINAEVWGEPYPLARSYWHRGLLLGALGQRGRALEDVGKGKKLAAGIEDAALRASMENDLAFEEAIAKAEDFPAEARDQLRACREIYRQEEHRHLELRASLHEARTHFVDGDPEVGERLLDEVLLGFEEHFADSILAEPRLVVEAESAFRQAIERRIDRGDFRAALHIAERSRYLPQEGFRAHPRTEPSLDDQPEGIAILFFQDMDDHILRWTLRGAGITHHRIATVPEDLARLAGKHLGDRGPRPSFSRNAASLYEGLIGTTLEEGPTRRLVVVPDRSTAWIPFALLQDGNGTLVERVEIVHAPSLAHALRRSEHEKETILAVGSSVGATTAEADLRPLPLAEAEARGVAELYPESMVLLANEATPTSFLEATRTAGTIHYAGHSRSDPFLPYRSLLHLAADAKNPRGEIDAGSLATVELSRTRLVILSSCSSATDTSHRHRSSFGLVNAFLAAGADAVIGAQWQVDDTTTHELMLHLHQQLAAGVSPPTALRNTQLAFLAASDSRTRDAHNWGAFRLVGSAVP